jgi:hypothetical protein
VRGRARPCGLRLLHIMQVSGRTTSLCCERGRREVVLCAEGGKGREGGRVKAEGQRIRRIGRGSENKYVCRSQTDQRQGRGLHKWAVSGAEYAGL